MSSQPQDVRMSSGQHLLVGAGVALIDGALDGFTIVGFLMTDAAGRVGVMPWECDEVELLRSMSKTNYANLARQAEELRG